MASQRVEGGGLWIGFVLVGIEGGGRQKATNESLRLAGGLFGRVEGRGDGWRSRNLTLVEVEGGGREEATNESSRLVGGSLGGQGDGWGWL